MRSVSFVDRFNFKFRGNVIPSAVALGDLDNDGCNELVCGNASGDLALFKDPDNMDPMKTSRDLGHITAVKIGDVFNEGRNLLVVISAVGDLYIFDSGNGNEEFSPKYHQRIPANVKEALIFDVNNDAKNELVVALTDRVVRSYQWNGSIFEPINKWEFGNQVGSITKNVNADGSNALIVAQPGGALLRVICGQELCGDLNYEPIASNVNFNVSSEIQGGFKV